MGKEEEVLTQALSEFKPGAPGEYFPADEVLYTKTGRSQGYSLHELHRNGQLGKTIVKADCISREGSRGGSHSQYTRSDKPLQELGPILEIIFSENLGFENRVYNYDLRELRRKYGNEPEEFVRSVLQKSGMFTPPFCDSCPFRESCRILRNEVDKKAEEYIQQSQAGGAST